MVLSKEENYKTEKEMKENCRKFLTPKLMYDKMTRVFEPLGEVLSQIIAPDPASLL